MNIIKKYSRLVIMVIVCVILTFVIFSSTMKAANSDYVRGN